MLLIWFILEQVRSQFFMLGLHNIIALQLPHIHSTTQNDGSQMMGGEWKRVKELLPFSSSSGQVRIAGSGAHVGS